MSVLQTQGLCRTYGTGTNAVEAVRHVDLSVEQGEYISLVGHSGCGKSTLLHLLGAVDRPTSGSVVIDGEDLTLQGEQRLAVFRRRRIGFVFSVFSTWYPF